MHVRAGSTVVVHMPTVADSGAGATAQAEGRCASTRTCTTAVQLPRPPRPPLSPELSAIELAGDVSVAAAHCVETHNAPAAVFLLAAV